MTRADFPVWRMLFPTLPTLFGKRRASRMERARWLAELRAQRYMPQPNGAMAEHARIMALSPEDAATDERQRVYPARYGP